MANTLDPMDLKQIITSHTDGLSNREIGDLLGISRNTVNNYIKLFKACDHKLDELLKMDVNQLQELFTSRTTINNDRFEQLMLYFDKVNRGRNHPGFTFQYHYNEYKQEVVNPYSYTQFMEHYKRKHAKVKGSMKLEHEAGKEVYIDYAGKKLNIIDRDAGELIPVEVFVAILPNSQYTYVEASVSQKREDMIESIGNALSFFGGVPKAIVSDNLKSAVTRASKYEPDINRTFKDFARHYNCVINPTRTYSPQDKALVESAVNLVYQRIYYHLSNMTFFSLSDLNNQIHILLEKYNRYKMQTSGISRLKQFIEIEKEHLSVLPNEPYLIKNYNRAKVQKMGYIYLSEQKNYYSVPYRYIGKHVEVQHTMDTVEIFYNKERLATHVKSYRRGNYTTIEEHLASTHRYYLSWSREFFVKQASSIGENAATYIGKLIDQQVYPEIGYKRAQGIVSLKKSYPDERIEKACLRALEYHICSFKTIETILKNNADLEPKTEQVEHIIKPHENLRSASNYK